MRKFAVAALLAVGITGAFAQQAGPAGGDPSAQAKTGKPGHELAQKMKELYAKLDLTADQKTKIEKLDKEQAEKVKAARKATKGDKDAWKEKNKSLREEHEKALNAILTPEQQKKFKELRKELMKELRKSRADKPAKP